MPPGSRARDQSLRLQKVHQIRGLVSVCTCVSWENIYADVYKVFTGTVHELRESGALPALLQVETEVGCEEGEGCGWV